MNDTFQAARMNPSPPPTLQERAIEAARMRTRELYHMPAPTDQLNNWYTNEALHPYIPSRVKDLYDDCGQTNRQQGAIFVAQLKLAQPAFCGNGIIVETAHTTLEGIYERVLTLYHARLRVIQSEGVARLSIWFDWFQEIFKPEDCRNNALIAACESTISFMEDDYIKRKVEFVTEVYAMLWQYDAPRAKAVLEDLGDMWPSVKDDLIVRLKSHGSGYNKLEKKLPQI